jgi:hypothetical protein
MKKGIIVLAIMLLLAGCSKGESTPTTNDNVNTENPGTTQAADKEGTTTEDVDTEVEQGEGFQFEFNGVAIPLNVDAAPVIEALGEPVEYFEAPSCAFQGLDKIFYYNGFEINTYPSGDKDFISTVNFLDDSVATDKGIYLGSTLDDVVAAYGENYEVENTAYTYTLGETELTIIVENDVVSAITFFAIVEGLHN